MRPGPPIHHRKKFIVLSIVILAIGAVAFLLIRRHNNNSRFNGKAIDNVSPSTQESISGLGVLPEVSTQRPIAVVIENHPDARPQSGLSHAEIVYETLAEGGITRYLALFQTQAADNIGPIRSARIYFAELANQWHAVFVHVGGNSVALKRISDGAYPNVSDINQYFFGDFFRRVTSRPAPHNVYTSVDKLREVMAKQKYQDKASNEHWMFKGDAPAQTTQAKTITIPFSTPGFTASYKYETTTNSYLRYLAGKADKDASNQEQLRAKTLVIQFASATDFPTDAVGTIDVELSGSGKSLVFEDGVVTKGTWKQTNGFTRFYDEAGKEIAFNRGPIWVEIVPSNLQQAVTYKNE